LRPSRLGSFQREVLGAFFRREHRFFLTGGGALVGFHLGHRETNDLDLFAETDALDDGVAVLADSAAELGATVEAIRTSPDFRRRLLRRGEEGVIVDLVRERVPQLVAEKPIVDGIRLDPPDEIFANKLCALLSRAEIRDLVDVRALEAAGYDIAKALEGGARKDGSLSPGQLAWVLSQITIGDEAVLPGGVQPAELRDYLRELVARLGVMAFPGK